MNQRLRVYNLFLFLILVSIYSAGQASFTTVTATLTDSSGQIWSNANVIATLRPAPNNPGLPLNNGLPITDSPQSIVTDNTGTFSLILDDTSHVTPKGATWIFNIFPNASVQNGSSVTLGITGTTLNLSGPLSSILIVPSVFAAPSINRAYTDGQVTGGNGGVYWNTTGNLLKGCNFVAGVCTWVTIGNLSVPGNHFYIPYNNGSGGFTASVNLQFNDSTNTFSTTNGTFSNLLSGIFSTTTANPATSGIFRHSAGDTDCWRNNANNANLCLSKNANDQFTFFGALLNQSLVTPTISSPTSTGTDNGTETLVNKSLTSPTSTGTDAGTETLNSKTLNTPTIVTPVINGASTGTGVQGTDTKLASAATISTTPGTPVCSTANGGVTTTSCPTIQASINAPQRTTSLVNSSISSNTQTIVASESVSFPATAGTYRALVSYGLWGSVGANICQAEVIDTTNTRAWALSGQNLNGSGFFGLSASELSTQTYAASATATFTLQILCNAAATITSTNGTANAWSPAVLTNLTVTPVLSN